ncbi:hypothetical protein VTL71DRAFT_5599 [Oculimacula yallundae]|uniref:FAD dependent oxidoreductase domain-containing protein n=1 Tax=Oculimacula yallundae TaxID=86028 RepID=A0ABR4C1M3_9HELO
MEKIIFSMLALTTLISTTTAVCSAPNVMVSVGAVKFPVPLYNDCKYGDPGSVIPAPPSPAPPTAKTASADYLKFVDKAGGPLDAASMKSLLAFFGQAVPLPILLEQTICTVTDKKNSNAIYSVADGDGKIEGQEELSPGKMVDVASYRCIIDLFKYVTVVHDSEFNSAICSIRHLASEFRHQHRTACLLVLAGVSGLTTALLLSRAEPTYEISVIAKHIPGDYDVEYCSPWAGADYMPTFGILVATVYTRLKDEEAGRVKFPADPWWKELFPDYKDVPTTSLGPGIARAATFTTVCINTAIYLPWLFSQCLAAGITFERHTITHISSAFSLATFISNSASEPPDLVINCTGLGSLALGGVEDKAMYPVRGQVALVRNSITGVGAVDAHGTISHAGFSLSGTDDGDDKSCYGMTRAAGGGTVLGGVSQVGSWDGNVDSELAERIWTGRRGFVRTDGTGVQWDVIRHGVGLRPAREGGIRVEKEYIELSTDATDIENGNVQGANRKRIKGWVVHNYGHAGEGYQTSVGCAEDAVALVESIFQDMELGT